MNSSKRFGSISVRDLYQRVICSAIKPEIWETRFGCNSSCLSMEYYLQKSIVQNHIVYFFDIDMGDSRFRASFSWNIPKTTKTTFKIGRPIFHPLPSEFLLAKNRLKRWILWDYDIPTWHSLFSDVWQYHAISVCRQ